MSKMIDYIYMKVSLAEAVENSRQSREILSKLHKEMESREYVAVPS
jgi:hypothetical protein